MTNKNLDDKCMLKLPYISDSLIRKIKANIRKNNLNVRLVCSGNKKLRNALQNSNKVKKHDNCELCDRLPAKYNCDKTCVVYQFTCKSCFSKYIGKTSRPFHVRFKEHKSSIANKNNISALSDHVKICDNCHGIDDFSIDFLRCVRDPVEASLAESRFIDLLKPKMNRRHEMVGTGGLRIN